MSAINFEDRPEFIRGRAAEQAVSRWLQAKGWFILPAYDYAGKDRDKAPLFSGAAFSLIAPDLLAGKLGSVTWFEVKLKHAASRGWTGIPLVHWLNYVEVRAVTGAEVWLVFVHEDEDEVRMGEVGMLAEQECTHDDDWYKKTEKKTLRTYEGDSMSRGGMAFFCWDCLLPGGRTSDIMEAYK